MTEPEMFYSPEEPAVAEQTIEKSVFIAVMSPVCSPEEAREHRRQVRAAYPKARHYVYAYRLWHDRAERASDDGEPQGTGGRPVLDALAYRRLWDAQIVVVRYFGGVLLGTGGLARAYGGSARRVLDKAVIRRMAEHGLFSLRISYAFADEFHRMCARQKWMIEEETWEEKVLVRLALPVEEEEQFVSWLARGAHGHMDCLKKERGWRETAHAAHADEGSP